MTLNIDQIHMMHLFQKDIKLHSHNFFELVYVVSGQCTHRLGNEQSRIKAGDYFIIDTGSKHSYINTDKKFEIINCLFMPDYIDRALTDCPTLADLLSNKILRFGVPLDICAADRTFHDDDGTVGRLMHKMVKEYEQAATGYMELLRCYLTQALVITVRASEQVKSDMHPATDAVIKYLQEHFDKPLSLDAIGKTSGYTAPYISGVFSKDMGMTIRNFLQRLRVEKACRLLDETNLSTADIAQKTGYNDPKHFADVFKRYKGVSPKAYRHKK